MEDKLDILKTADDYINNLKAGIEEAVGFFQGGKEVNGSKAVVQIVDGIQWLTQALTITKDIQKEPLNLNELNAKLGEIVEAYENGDHILVGDLFQYEIIPILETFQQGIEKSIESS